MADEGSGAGSTSWVMVDVRQSSVPSADGKRRHDGNVMWDGAITAFTALWTAAIANGWKVSVANFADV
jgi:hypothetical protein